MRNRVDFVHGLFSTYAENERLKERIDSYDDVAQQNKSYKKEIESLKEEPDLNQALTGYKKVAADVVTCSPDNWQGMLIADEGSKDGIEASMAVISQEGLIGQMIEVNTASSKIELLSSFNKSSNHFPVRVSSANGGVSDLLKNYDEKLHALVMIQLADGTDTKEGDVVQISGPGGNSPANLPVDTVIKTKLDSYGLDREVYVKPYVEMYDVSVVAIVQRLVENQSMLKKEIMKYYLPVILFFLMLLDGCLIGMLGGWSGDSYMSNAHFLILVLLCRGMAFERRYLLITAIVPGTVYDAYYIGVIGICVVALPLTVWLTYVMKDIIHVNIFAEFLSMIILVTGHELFMVVVQLILKLTIVNNTYFTTRLLGPILLLNIVIFVLFILPFEKLLSDE